jgi:phosphoadenosine phosphosulfate reductase
MNIKAQLGRLWSNEFAPEIAPKLDELNCAIEPLSAVERIERVLELLPGEHVLTSSFGVQSAVMLHLVNLVLPGVPVVLLDTGYLFPETYSFIDELTDRLKLNLKVFRAESSAAWQETRFGKLWDQGFAGIERYNRINKQEPLDRALNELDARTWFTGLRRTQAKTRSQISPIEFKCGRYKVHPLYDWNERDIGRYLEKHHLPYHP